MFKPAARGEVSIVDELHLRGHLRARRVRGDFLPARLRRVLLHKQKLLVGVLAAQNGSPRVRKRLCARLLVLAPGILHVSRQLVARRVDRVKLLSALLVRLEQPLKVRKALVAAQRTLLRILVRTRAQHGQHRQAVAAKLLREVLAEDHLPGGVGRHAQRANARALHERQLRRAVVRKREIDFPLVADHAEHGLCARAVHPALKRFPVLRRNLVVPAAQVRRHNVCVAFYRPVCSLLRALRRLLLLRRVAGQRGKHVGCRRGGHRARLCVSKRACLLRVLRRLFRRLFVCPALSLLKVAVVHQLSLHGVRQRIEKSGVCLLLRVRLALCGCAGNRVHAVLLRTVLRALVAVPAEAEGLSRLRQRAKESFKQSGLLLLSGRLRLLYCLSRRLLRLLHRLVACVCRARRVLIGLVKRRAQLTRDALVVAFAFDFPKETLIGLPVLRLVPALRPERAVQLGYELLVVLLVKVGAGKVRFGKRLVDRLAVKAAALRFGERLQRVRRLLALPAVGDGADALHHEREVRRVCVDRIAVRVVEGGERLHAPVRRDAALHRVLRCLGRCRRPLVPLVYAEGRPRVDLLPELGQRGHLGLVIGALFVRGHLSVGRDERVPLVIVLDARGDADHVVVCQLLKVIGVSGVHLRVRADGEGVAPVLPAGCRAPGRNHVVLARPRGGYQRAVSGQLLLRLVGGRVLSLRRLLHGFGRQSVCAFHPVADAHRLAVFHRALVCLAPLGNFLPLALFLVNRAHASSSDSLAGNFLLSVSS